MIDDEDAVEQVAPVLDGALAQVLSVHPEKSCATYPSRRSSAAAMLFYRHCNQ